MCVIVGSQALEGLYVIVGSQALEGLSLTIGLGAVPGLGTFGMAALPSALGDTGDGCPSSAAGSWGQQRSRVIVGSPGWLGRGANLGMSPHRGGTPGCPALGWDHLYRVLGVI